MTREQLLNAGDAIVKIIVAQAEKRLEGQVAFAAVQDARGGALVSGSVALGAAAAAVAAGAFTLKGIGSPIGLSAAVATLGFSSAAFVALWASRACNFHSSGWYPNDFAQDLADGKTVKELDADFALDLQIRLSQNRTALIKRGDLYNAATYVLLGTPLVTLLIAALIA